MKIKTITCHDVYNVGASLQAYALQTYLTELGHDVEIIDYKPEYLRGHFKLWGINNPRFDRFILRDLYCLAKLPKRLKNRFGKRKREFDHFTRTYLTVTKHTYHSNDELKENPPDADVFFAGSDQIWNTFFNNGKDPAFYLEFVPKGKVKASYAASFATEDVQTDYKEKIAQWLNNMDYISVRELSGVSILKKLGINNGKQVLDPVFLLNRKVWERLAHNWKNPEKSPYILVYDFDNNNEIKQFVQNFSRKYGWKVISMLESSYYQNDYSKEGPIAFLSLIQNARVVVSNSFHATAFSIIFEKEFWVFNRKEKINTRMRDLLTLVGLEHRLNTKETHTQINYKDVKDKLEIAIGDSKEYISKVLQGVNNEKDKDIVYD